MSSEAGGLTSGVGTSEQQERERLARLIEKAEHRYEMDAEAADEDAEYAAVEGDRMREGSLNRRATVCRELAADYRRAAALLRSGSRPDAQAARDAHVHRALALVERSLRSEADMRAVQRETGGNGPELVQGILDGIARLYAPRDAQAEAQPDAWIEELTAPDGKQLGRGWSWDPIPGEADEAMIASGWKIVRYPVFRTLGAAPAAQQDYGVLAEKIVDAGYETHDEWDEQIADLTAIIERHFQSRVPSQAAAEPEVDWLAPARADTNRKPPAAAEDAERPERRKRIRRGTDLMAEIERLRAATPTPQNVAEALHVEEERELRAAGYREGYEAAKQHRLADGRLVAGSAATSPRVLEALARIEMDALAGADAVTRRLDEDVMADMDALRRALGALTKGEDV